MSTESIIILAIVIAAAVAVAAWQLRKKKANPASPPAQATQPSAAQATQPSTFVDIATLTRVFPDGTSDKIAPTTMRQWLYGLSIGPASAAGMGLLAQALIDAPRSLGKRSLGAGQGDFGGGS